MSWFSSPGGGGGGGGAKEAVRNPGPRDMRAGFETGGVRSPSSERTVGSRLPAADGSGLESEPATGRWKVEMDAYSPKTHMLADFQFGDGPLGLSFLKREGVFRVGSVLDSCKSEHVKRHGGSRLSSEVTARPGAAGGSLLPPPPGTLTPAVGDRIVAVNGVLVDSQMTQSLLGDLIRRAPRPVRLTMEPIAVSGDLLPAGTERGLDGIHLDSNDASELQQRLSESAVGRGMALSAADRGQRLVQLGEQRDALAARVGAMARQRDADEARLRGECAEILVSFEAEYARKRELKRLERQAAWAKGLAALDVKYASLAMTSHFSRSSTYSHDSLLYPFPSSHFSTWLFCQPPGTPHCVRSCRRCGWA